MGSEATEAEAMLAAAGAEAARAAATGAAAEGDAKHNHRKSDNRSSRHGSNSHGSSNYGRAEMGEAARGTVFRWNYITLQLSLFSFYTKYRFIDYQYRTTACSFSSITSVSILGKGQRFFDCILFCAFSLLCSIHLAHCSFSLGTQIPSCVCNCSLCTVGFVNETEFWQTKYLLRRAYSVSE